MIDENPWKIVSSRSVYKNQWIEVQEDKVITPTGNDGMYAYIKTNDSVTVAALNDKNEIYLARLFKYPAKMWAWETPGGGGDKQDLLVAAKRELEEETGIIAGEWTLLGSPYVCNGLMVERMGVFVAQDLSFAGHKEDEDERIAGTKFVSMPEATAMVARGEIDDCQTITVLFMVQAWLAGRQT